MGKIGEIINALLNGNVKVENASVGSLLAALFILSPFLLTLLVGWRKGRGWAGFTLFVSVMAWIAIVWSMATAHWGFYAPSQELSLIALPFLS